MARPRLDGTPPRQPIKKKFTDAFVSAVKPESRLLTVYDTKQGGLAMTVQPVSGKKTYKAIYYVAGFPRWFHIGPADVIGLADARKLTKKVMYEASLGKDPVAERQAERSRGTFEELSVKYVEEYAKRKNKSWEQADRLVRRYLVPKWGKLQAGGVTRAHAKAMMRTIKKPILANQVLATASAIFAWGVREEIVALNPCQLVEKNETRSRERILSDSELPQFWKAFDTSGLVQSTALKVILLTGQRPGEVAHMRREHIVDGWWEMPGEPVAALNWPGTKNGESHRVWLSEPVLALLSEMPDSGMVFAGRRGRPVTRLDAAMRKICSDLGVPAATPHDLRRTFSTKVARLGFGTDAMNRVTNHKEGGIASVYDRHHYSSENQKIFVAVADHIMALMEGRPGDNVVEFKR